MEQSMTREWVLRSFAAEENSSKETLETYIRKFPEFAVDLTELSLEFEVVEFERQPDPEIAPFTDADQDLVHEALCGRNAKGLAKDLGFPRLLIGALRDRSLRPETVPQSFLRRIAEAASIGKTQLVAYLCLPKGFSPNVSMKSAGKPGEHEKVSFDEFISGLALDDAQTENLLAGNPDHGSN